MKITIYTIKDCAFSKQEKEYLNTNKLVFEEKDLETNKDFLTEMLAISNNFAGTPVTRVEKDDGSIAVLKGFTKGEFDTVFGFAPIPAENQSPAAAPSAAPGQVNDTPIPADMPPKVEDVKPVAEVVPPVETISPAPAIENPQPVNPLTNEVNNESPTTVDPLKSVMDDLQSKSQPTDPPIQPTSSDSTASPALPNIPEPDFK